MPAARAFDRMSGAWNESDVGRESSGERREIAHERGSLEAWQAEVSGEAERWKLAGRAGRGPDVIPHSAAGKWGAASATVTCVRPATHTLPGSLDSALNFSTELVSILAPVILFSFFAPTSYPPCCLRPEAARAGPRVFLTNRRTVQRTVWLFLYEGAGILRPEEARAVDGRAAC